MLICLNVLMSEVSLIHGCPLRGFHCIHGLCVGPHMSLPYLLCQQVYRAIVMVNRLETKCSIGNKLLYTYNDSNMLTTIENIYN